MVRNTVQANAAEVDRGNKDRFKSGDMLSSTLVNGIFVPVFEVQADRTETYMGGYGPNNRDAGEVGWADVDIQNSNNNAADGVLRWEVYRDSSKEDLVAKSSTFRSEDLRSSQGASRRDKMVLPQQAPAAPQDGYLVLGMDADSGSDGDSLSSSNSATDLGVPYARIA